MIKKGADINAVDADGKTPLHLVFDSLTSVEKPSREQIALVNLFIQNGAKINPSLKTKEAKNLLHQTKSAKLAEFIIAQGVDVNAKDENGNTPLHFAVSINNNELVNLLIRNQADVNIKNKKGEAPLNIAIGFDGDYYRLYNPQIAKLLINNGANVNVKNSVGNYSLLHLAVENNDKDFVNYLLDKGADINAKDSDNSTPLYSKMFVTSDEEKISLLLIKRGADICIGNNGISRLDIAKRHRRFHPEVYNYIKQKGLDKKCNLQSTKEPK